MKHFNTPIFVLFLFLFNNSFAQLTKDDLDDKNYGNYVESIAPQMLQQSTNSNAAFMRSAPPAPAATGDNLCGPGTASLSATASAGGTLNWYAAATGGTSLGTGATYNPTVSTTTNYWVDETTAAGGGGTPGTYNMSTPYNSNNGQRGCMFDITATNTITITNFDVNLYAGTTANYEIYYCPSTHVGNENNAGAWTLLGSATGIASAGNNIPTPLPIVFSVTIPAGQTYSFYVTNDFGAGTSYTDGTAVGNFLASDANMTVYEGVGKSYPFGLTFAVRNFNGTIYYDVGTGGGGGGTSPRTLVTANVKEPAYATAGTTTTSNTTCTVNEGGVDWTYYYNSSNSNDLLFAIAHDPNNLGNNSFTANVEVTVNNNSASTGYYTQANTGAQLARFVMGRYWNVNLTSGNIVDPVWIRYYYQNAEKTAISNAVSNWQSNNGGLISPMYFFKTDGVPFNPASDLHASGVANSLELVNYTDNQTTAGGVNYVEIQGISSFSGGGLITGVVPVGGSTTGTSILLDLELANFSVQKEAQTSVLNWATTREKEVSNFVIERSLDGINFNAIGEVQAMGTTNATSHYEWVDEMPATAINYYRLKIVENDGLIQYSKIRAVAFDHESMAVQVQPNPFREGLTINLEAVEQQVVDLIVVNALGQLVYNQKYVLGVGRNLLEIEDTNYWAAGCYIVTIKGEHQAIQRKVVKN